jgi:ribosomal protein L31
MKKHLHLIAAAWLVGCGGRVLVSNLNEYEVLDPDTRYKILSEKEDKFELAVHIKSHDFYTEERHLIAKAKNQFRKIANSICIKNSKELGKIDDNAFIDSADSDSKAAHVRNWVYYKRKE